MNTKAVIQSAKHHIATAAPHVRKRATMTIIQDLIDIVEANDSSLLLMKQELDTAWLKEQMSYDTQGVNWVHKELAILTDNE